jgi:ribonuclease P protein component
VLARTHRLRNSGDYGLTIRQGRRCSTRTVVVHALFEGPPELPRIGLVVNQALGSAVARNKVKRRLRAIMRAQLPCLPGGRIVIRALPAAASADFASLGADVSRCIGQLEEATS